MAKTSCVELISSKKEVLVRDLTISNEEVYDFLSDKKDKEDWLKKSVIVGCAGLKQMVLVSNVDFVEKEFNKFLQKAKDEFKEVSNKIDETFDINHKQSPIALFTTKLDDTFDLRKSNSPLAQFKDLIEEYFDTDSGKIKKLIDQSFDLDNKKSSFSKLLEEIKENSDLEEDDIKNLLDPNKTDSPAKLLKEEILTKFKEFREEDIKELNEKVEQMRDKILAEEAIRDEKEKGTQKGLEFEDEIYEELTGLTNAYKDTLEIVGGKKVAGSKVGDIIIDLDGDPKNRIVFECKDAKYGLKRTIDEINEAIKNRKAKFGIFLFKKKEHMPAKLCPIKITNNYIITCMEKENLCLSYRLARVLLLKEKPAEETEVDFCKISKELAKIEDSVRNIDSMQAKVANILNSGGYLKQNLSALQSQINLSIDSIRRLMSDKFEDVEEESDEEYFPVEEQTSDELDEVSPEEFFMETKKASADAFKFGERECIICGKKFNAIPSTKKYCSNECRDVLNHLKYAKYLKPPERILKEKLIEKGFLK